MPIDISDSMTKNAPSNVVFVPGYSLPSKMPNPMPPRTLMIIACLFMLITGFPVADGGNMKNYCCCCINNNPC